MSLVGEKEEFVSARAPARARGTLQHPLDCLRKMISLCRQVSLQLHASSDRDIVSVPGSTFVTQSSLFLVPFSTVGNAARSSGELLSRTVRASFQLYICSLEPDEPASMTIPKRREESHGSAVVGGGIYAHRAAAGAESSNSAGGRRGPSWPFSSPAALLNHASFLIDLHHMGASPYTLSLVSL